jgi:hypothetical protein
MANTLPAPCPLKEWRLSFLERFKRAARKSRMRRTQQQNLLQAVVQSTVQMDVEKLIACMFCRPPLWNEANPDHHNHVLY